MATNPTDLGILERLLRQAEQPHTLKSLLTELDEHVSAVMCPAFQINVTEARAVPSPSDRGLTFDNLDTNKKDCKILESCVLYIDIRGSSAMNVENDAATLAKLYSVFAKSMAQAASFFGGQVRNITGDRVMVVFPPERCFYNAVSTAVLFNTISSKLIAPQFPGFRCGIGIDFGKMLSTKVGIVKRGDERELYRDLVWLGRPANVASKLTDLANKDVTDETPAICEGYRSGRSGLLGLGDGLNWQTVSPIQFISKLKDTFFTNSGARVAELFSVLCDKDSRAGEKLSFDTDHRRGL